MIQSLNYGKGVKASQRFSEPLPAKVIQLAYLESVLQIIVPVLIGIWVFDRFINKLLPCPSVER